MAEQNVSFAGLVDGLVRPLVDHPEDISIAAEIDGDTESIEIRVNDEDTGKVIGRQGRVIKSIRTLTRAAASRIGMQVEVEIID